MSEENDKLIQKLIKDFKQQKVKNPQEMPFITAQQFNKIMDRFIDYLKELKSKRETQ